jgi:dTDP-4-dehydrorhamnose 3,5-epimerase
VIFRETPLPGAFLIETERFEDERGAFVRTYCRQELESHGIDPTVAQCNLSINPRRGTLRGLHFQAGARNEAKLLRVLRGAIFDAIVDLRPASPTYLRHFTVELRAEEEVELFVPKGMAHSFLTLEDATDVFYQISEPFTPGAARGYRYDDPAFGIAWPLEVAVISDRDRALPFFSADAPPELGL